MALFQLRPHPSPHPAEAGCTGTHRCLPWHRGAHSQIRPDSSLVEGVLLHGTCSAGHGMPRPTRCIPVSQACRWGGGWGRQAPERRHCCVTKRPEVPGALGIHGERFPGDDAPSLLDAPRETPSPAWPLRLHPRSVASSIQSPWLLPPSYASHQGTCSGFSAPLGLPAPSHNADLEKKGSALLPSVLRARRWALKPPSSPPQATTALRWGSNVWTPKGSPESQKGLP